MPQRRFNIVCVSITLSIAIILLSGCNSIDSPVSKTIYFTVNLNTVGIQQPFTIYYVLNGQTHYKFFGYGYDRSMVVDSLQVKVDPKTNNVLEQKWTGLSYLSVKLADTVMYEVQLERSSPRWDDWQYSDASNTWSLNLDYALTRYYFIVENRDTVRPHSIRFSTERFKDSLVSIRRGYSAQVLHQMNVGNFSVSIRPQSNPSRALLQRYMQAQILTSSQSSILDSTQWQMDRQNFTFYVRHSIYP